MAEPAARSRALADPAGSPSRATAISTPLMRLSSWRDSRGLPSSGASGDALQAAGLADGTSTVQVGGRELTLLQGVPTGRARE
jgi:hypothetical protein